MSLLLCMMLLSTLWKSRRLLRGGGAQGAAQGNVDTRRKNQARLQPYPDESPRTAAAARAACSRVAPENSLSAESTGVVALATTVITSPNARAASGSDRAPGNSLPAESAAGVAALARTILTSPKT